MATGKITNNLKVSTLQLSYTAGANVTIRGVVTYRSGNTIVVEVYFDTSAELSNNSSVVRFSSGLPQPVGAYATAFAKSLEGGMAMVSLEASNTSEIRAWGTVPTGSYYYALFNYIVR